MAKTRTVYICSACGTRVPQWAGQCSDCGGWNTLSEGIPAAASSAGSRFSGFSGGAAGHVTPLAAIEADSRVRTSVGMGELDRVLGGGLVTGSVVLIGGDPGIGKSTLLLQVMSTLAAAMPSLYVTGEESPEQIAMRAQRLGIAGDYVQLLSETSVEQIIATACKEKPRVMVLDSIQTLYTEALQSAPGSVAQVRESVV